MCRFAFYLGPALTLDSLTTEPVHSIIKQSYHSKERVEPLNGDGFGVAWYVPEISPAPAVFRSITPAWNNRNLVHLARVTRSGCILAHVRAASPGLAVTETNCHPFVHGRFAFMHNGLIASFARVKRRLSASLSDESFAVIEGSTDSELLFALFLDRMRSATAADPADAMADAVDATIATTVEALRDAGVEEASYFNIVVADGTSGVASRVTTGFPDGAASLYWHEGKRYVCEEGFCRMVAPDTPGGAILVCSEPLSADAGWEKVPPNHLVVVRADRSIGIRRSSL